MKKKSPKFYKVKTKSMKSTTAHNVLSVVVMVAAAGLVGFVGYSIAKPFIDEDSEIDSSLQIQASVTTATTETTETTTGTTGESEAVVSSADKTQTTVETELSKQVDSTQQATTVVTTVVAASDAVVAETTAVGTAETDTVETNSATTETVVTTEQASEEEPTSAITTASSSKQGITLSAFSEADDAEWLSDSVLDSADTFSNALDQVTSSKAVVVPMKLAGGLLNYDSSVSYVAGTEICDGSMTASEIVSIAKEKGLEVYALIDVTNDNAFPELNKNAAIPLSDGGGRWLDQSPEKGGKPWMSPYSDTTVSYMTAIIQELDQAGFSAAICENFVYPSFYESDREYIDVEDYFGENRYDAMEKLADAMVKASSNMTVVLDMEP